MHEAGFARNLTKVYLNWVSTLESLIIKFLRIINGHTDFNKFYSEEIVREIAYLLQFLLGNTCP